MTQDKEIELSLGLLPGRTPREEYIKAFEFHSDVRGKYFLDVGSGGCDAVSWLNGQGAVAYGVDFRYSNIPEFSRSIDEGCRIVEENFRRVYGDTQWGMTKKTIIEAKENFETDFKNRNHYIAAFAGQLPFPDNIFDVVFSLTCITHGLDDDMCVLESAVSEGLRVVRPGGVMKIYPFLESTHSSATINHISLARDLKTKQIKWKTFDVDCFKRLEIYK